MEHDSNNLPKSNTKEIVPPLSLPDRFENDLTEGEMPIDQKTQEKKKAGGGKEGEEKNSSTTQKEKDDLSTRHQKESCEFVRKLLVLDVDGPFSLNDGEILAMLKVCNMEDIGFLCAVFPVSNVRGRALGLFQSTFGII